MDDTGLQPPTPTAPTPPPAPAIPPASPPPAVIPETAQITKPVNPLAKGVKKHAKKFVVGALMVLLLAGGAWFGVSEVQKRQQTESQAGTNVYGYLSCLEGTKPVCSETKCVSYNTCFPDGFDPDNASSYEWRIINNNCEYGNDKIGVECGKNCQCVAQPEPPLPPVDVTNCADGDFFTSSGGHKYCFIVSNQVASYSQAQAACQPYGQLASLVDGETKQDVLDLIAKFGSERIQWIINSGVNSCVGYDRCGPYVADTCTATLAKFPNNDPSLYFGTEENPAGYLNCSADKMSLNLIGDVGAAKLNDQFDQYGRGAVCELAAAASPNPSPSPSPSPSPTVACVDLTKDTATPKINDEVTFTCEANVTAAAPAAFFRAKVGTLDWWTSPAQAVNTTTNKASFDFDIDKTGDWEVQCRVCTDSGGATCTAWGQAQ